ncbi:hypothetical protein BKH43_06230 [Helicobacter sp. 13S00401-1]|uniref:HAD family hydrolase n=1 Tax=Helicobacter sp. 13S00401-1 TaxID=1905758 RepID=UPI000BA5B25C|nr:HAD family hydrolase [Helicobacter sp. 13S00401-1]PAF50086.1 hypothetical protein BKH43_06230 [Helicobacter sp. 13S00401-1]
MQQSLKRQEDGQKAVFFDRDGVINIDTNYTYKIEDFHFLEDFFDIARFFKARKYKLVVVTNQSGIERGFYNVQDFLTLSAYMQRSLKAKLGFEMDQIYFCPFLNSIHRKPNAGMLLRAKRDLNLDLSKSVMIGDRLSDMEAGFNAGIKSLYLIQDKTVRSKDKDASHRLELGYKNIDSLLEIKQDF